MEFNFRKKIFLIGEPNKRTSLYLTQRMHDALTFISKQTNQSIPEVIYEALEQYLTHLANSKAIPMPKDEIEEEKVS